MLLRYPALDVANEESLKSSYPISLVALIQVWQNPGSTGKEVHGLMKRDGELRESDYGGIEVFVPMDQGFELYANGEWHKVNPGQAIVIYPGDVHEVRYAGQGQGRMLIVGGHGFSRGTKLEENEEKRTIETTNSIRKEQFNPDRIYELWPE